jgi:hypothetical protein
MTISLVNRLRAGSPHGLPGENVIKLKPELNALVAAGYIEAHERPPLKVEAEANSDIALQVTEVQFAAPGKYLTPVAKHAMSRMPEVPAVFRIKTRLFWS